MRIKIQQVGIYETLVSQLDRIFRHNRQGSFHTKRRYYEAMKRFCAYLADVYHLQKLSNISGKHLVSCFHLLIVCLLDLICASGENSS